MRRNNSPHDSNPEAIRQRQQIGAALLLAVVVLALILVRAKIHGLLPPHWWRPW